MQPNILITGAGGLLSTYIVELLLKETNKIYPLTIDELDITDEERVKKTIIAIKPALLINCAAWTDVDGAETNWKEAFKVNAYGARLLAKYTSDIECKIVHISTDYIFDGKKGTPYKEDDTPNPLNVYGRSKLEGERLVHNIGFKPLIIRTSWLFGKTGKNFVKSIIQASKGLSELKVVDDQTGIPTYGKDLASAIYNLIKKDVSGVVHFSNQNQTTWYEFAKEIFKILGSDIPIFPIKSVVLAKPAKRPEYSVLDTSKFTQITGNHPRHWRDALYDFLQNEYLKP